MVTTSITSPIVNSFDDAATPLNVARDQASNKGARDGENIKASRNNNSTTGRRRRGVKNKRESDEATQPKSSAITKTNMNDTAAAEESTTKPPAAANQQRSRKREPPRKQQPPSTAADVSPMSRLSPSKRPKNDESQNLSQPEINTSKKVRRRKKRPQSTATNLVTPSHETAEIETMVVSPGSTASNEVNNETTVLNASFVSTEAVCEDTETSFLLVDLGERKVEKSEVKKKKPRQPRNKPDKLLNTLSEEENKSDAAAAIKIIPVEAPSNQAICADVSVSHGEEKESQNLADDDDKWTRGKNHQRTNSGKRVFNVIDSVDDQQESNNSNKKLFVSSNGNRYFRTAEGHGLQRDGSRYSTTRRQRKSRARKSPQIPVSEETIQIIGISHPPNDNGAILKDVEQTLNKLHLADDDNIKIVEAPVEHTTEGEHLVMAQTKNEGSIVQDVEQCLNQLSVKDNSEGDDVKISVKNDYLDSNEGECFARNNSSTYEDRQKKEQESQSEESSLLLSAQDPLVAPDDLAANDKLCLGLQRQFKELFMDVNGVDNNLKDETPRGESSISAPVLILANSIENALAEVVEKNDQGKVDSSFEHYTIDLSRVEGHAVSLLDSPHLKGNNGELDSKTGSIGHEDNLIGNGSFVQASEESDQETIHQDGAIEWVSSLKKEYMEESRLETSAVLCSVEEFSRSDTSAHEASTVLVSNIAAAPDCSTEESANADETRRQIIPGRKVRGAKFNAFVPLNDNSHGIPTSVTKKNPCSECAVCVIL